MAQFKYRVLVVGAGFAGSVCAERLAAAGISVLLCDRRPHLGGNANDCIDEHGVLIHPYGPHIFHTESRRIFAYLSRFTDWRFYEHRVRAWVEGRDYPIPINRLTLNALYDLDLTEDQVEAWLEGVRLQLKGQPSNSEEVVLSRVGADLCDKFFRNYTRKQWGINLAQLAPGVAARIPYRCNDDDRYFTDTYQFMPTEGYSSLFRRMTNHPRIEIALGVEYRDLRGKEDFSHTVFTGPIDEYFDYRFGPLPYRSLRFEHYHVSDAEKVQKVAVYNYPNEHDYTRITEFKHLTGQQIAGTSLVREYPQDEGDPYYPIPRSENEARYKQYEALAAQDSRVSFVGRLAQYRYYNMDQVVGAALARMEALIPRLLGTSQ